MATNTTEETSRSTVDEVKEKGAEIVSTAQEQVAEKASEVREDAAFQLREQVDQRSTQAGEQVDAVAHALRSGGRQLRTEGKASSAQLVDELAQRAERLGGYLKSADADRILGDIEEFARRRPWLAAGGAALAGFAASRVLKASSDRRYETRSTGSLAYDRTGLAAGVER